METTNLEDLDRIIEFAGVVPKLGLDLRRMKHALPSRQPGQLESKALRSFQYTSDLEHDVLRRDTPCPVEVTYIRNASMFPRNVDMSSSCFSETLWTTATATEAARFARSAHCSLLFCAFWVLTEHHGIHRYRCILTDLSNPRNQQSRA